MRDYRLSKTRDGKPKVVLHQDGRKVNEHVCKSNLMALRLGRAWRESE